MGKFLDLRNLFKNIYLDDEIEIKAEMKNHINFKVGGPADILLKPNRVEQVVQSLKICKKNNIPYYVIGNGSNLLVKDGGIRGAVIKLTEMNNIEVNGCCIKADCGAMLSDVSTKAFESSLTGCEFACGIPGSVGGAVFMNAGAYDGEIKNIIKEATVIDDEGNLLVMSKDELDLGYRSSKVMREHYIVVGAVFELHKGNKDNIKEKIDELTRKREEKQPLEYPSAGSTFKRPEGYFAGKLIQDSGLKGYTLGGAAVSDKHSGFVINKENATAKDILDLIAYIQKEVKSQFGVELHTEVRVIGEDN